MDLQQVLEAVKGYGVKNVTLTGGEPLLHQGVAELLETLSREGFRVNVETNGTVPAKWRLPGLFYTMDWKCKSSAMSSHMKLENMETIGEGDVLKFVVGSVEDLEETESVVERLAAKKSAQALQKNLPDGVPQGMPSIFVSPVFGKLSNVEIVNWMLASDVMVKNDARFQVQLHKVVWDPDLRGV
jgi:7-carboxy-7-deazaguanine synthase